MKKKFESAEQELKFIDDVIELLNDLYIVNGEQVSGQSVSYLQDWLRGKWKGISNNNDFVDTLKAVGFEVNEGRGVRGNRRAEVVYL